MKNRIYAFLIHLVLSVLVATMTIIMVFFVWYPNPLDQAVGVTEIFLILLGVDIIMGPVMTLVVYKQGKPGLMLDLCIIVILQFAALTYGISTVFMGRPAFIVFNKDRFDVTRWIDLDQASLKIAQQANNLSAEASWLSPRWVGAVAPVDKKRAEEILFTAVMGGADWPQLPELYVPLEQVKTQMLKRAQPLSTLRQRDKEGVLTNEQNEQLRWLPLHSKNKDFTVLIDGNTAEIIKVIDIDPWS